MNYQHDIFLMTQLTFQLPSSPYLHKDNLTVTINTEQSFIVSNLPKPLSVNYLLHTGLLIDTLQTALSLDQATLE